MVGETSQLRSVNARLNLRRWTVLVDPVEQELGSYRELLAGLAEERSIRVESGAHKSLFPCLLPSMYFCIVCTIWSHSVRYPLFVMRGL
jgi:hypothetical protein